MRKIVERVILVIFVIVVLYIGWTVFQMFFNASSKRNENAAVQIVKEIREAELKLQPKFGRLLTLDELIKEKAIVLKSPDEVVSGYRFSLVSDGVKFMIRAIPIDSKDGSGFSVDEKGNFQKPGN